MPALSAGTAAEELLRGEWHIPSAEDAAARRTLTEKTKKVLMFGSGCFTIV